MLRHGGLGRGGAFFVLSAIDRMDWPDSLRTYLTRPLVRPWALAPTVLVLLLAIPMLRPLRQPEPGLLSDSQAARFATVQAIVESSTLAIDNSAFQTREKVLIDGHWYADQPPAFAMLLAGTYRVMHWMGLSFERNPVLVMYVLTLLGVTLPVAVGCGLVYRLGRLFELPRPWRSGLACCTVFSGGWIAYAVAMNSHAPAAAGVLAAVACLFHVALVKNPAGGGGWLIAAGLFAGLAAVIEPTASVFAVLLVAVILSMRWSPSQRAGGILLYLIGLSPPLLLHTVLNVPLTGDFLPVSMHMEFTRSMPSDRPAAIAVEQTYDDGASGSEIGQGISKVFLALFGPQGLFSHFPAALFGIFGISAVMHRHWPGWTKVLAGATAVGSVLILLAATIGGPGLRLSPAFAAPWSVVFMPLLLLWTGAWLRRRHGPVKWSLFLLLTLFSVLVGLAGMTSPLAPASPNEYTAWSAAKRALGLIEPPDRSVRRPAPPVDRKPSPGTARATPPRPGESPRTVEGIET